MGGYHPVDDDVPPPSSEQITITSPRVSRNLPWIPIEYPVRAPDPHSLVRKVDRITVRWERRLIEKKMSNGLPESKVTVPGRLTRTKLVT